MGDATIRGTVQRWKGRARAVGANTRVGQTALARRARGSLIDLVVRAGFVDLEWYQAATGIAFDTRERAVEHYLDGDGWIPLGPLLANGVLPAEGRGDDSNDAMVRYLQRGNLRYLPTPVFDDVAYASQHPEFADHPGRARGHFLAAATADTPLPVPDSWTGDAPTFGPWRAQMVKFAGLLAAREEQRKALGAGSHGPGGALSSVAADSVSLQAEPAGAQQLDPSTEPAYAKFVTKSAELIDWRQLDAELPNRIPNRISILIPTIDDWRLTDAAVAALLRNCAGHDIEIIIVDNGSNAGAAIGLAQSLIGRDPTLTRIRPIWLPENLNFALGTNVAFAASTGARVVLLNNDTTVCSGWLDPLMRELDQPDIVGAQPLLLYGDGTIQTAGTGFPDCGGLPSHLLVGHPAEDARRLGSFDVSAVTAAALAMRATDYCRLRGLDPRFINGFEDVDLCLRTVVEAGARLRVATDSTVIHFESRTRTRTVTESNRQILWSTWRDRLPRPDTAEILGRAGFEIVRWDPGVIGRAGLGRIPLPVVARWAGAARDGRAAAVSQLRWAIKAPLEFTVDLAGTLAVPDQADAIVGQPPAPAVGPRATAIAPDCAANLGVDSRVQILRVVVNVAAALRELGQEVVIDCRAAHQRATSGLDDVVLVLAEEQQFEPQPGRPNLLWFWDGPSSGRGHDAASLDGDGWREEYDQFGFDFVWERAVTELTTDEAWLALAETFVTTAAAWRRDNEAQSSRVQAFPKLRG